MDIPKPHSAAYNRRNQTTFSWYSQSCPSESFLFRHNSPSPSTPSSGGRSPAKSPTYTKITEQKFKKQSRPMTSHAYDGGLFCNFTPRADYFVIDPEWVSEHDTIKKLSSERKPRSKTLPVRRRCKSAPPPKHRNPITWE
ncbi:uncharacterized protein LOC121380496 isoform X2 [Gigantopelta aegis]|nr:uncharacterized protein LOC121380496 isoform X2 [Gigantopelta aegis]XP_041365276.1 uncharacterized protein LOC121380496 isoform X2 [Gigantopelta aegis]